MDPNPDRTRSRAPGAPAAHGAADWVAHFGNAAIGGLAFALALVFIGGAIDAPLARIARGIDPQTARWLADFAALGQANGLLAATALAALLSVIVAVAQRSRRQRAAFFVLAQRAGFAFLAVALSVLVVQGLKFALGRAQPNMLSEYGAFHFALFSQGSFAASFPSGHATTAFAFATALALFVPRWGMVFFLAALAIAVARVAVGAHYPSDVLGGMVLGVALTFGVARLCARLHLVFRLEGGRLVRRGEGLVSSAMRRLFGRAPVRLDASAPSANGL